MEKKIVKLFATKDVWKEQSKVNFVERRKFSESFESLVKVVLFTP